MDCATCRRATHYRRNAGPKINSRAEWKVQTNIMYKDALHSAEVNDGGYRGNVEGRLYARARSACCLFAPTPAGVEAPGATLHGWDANVRT